MRSMWGVGICLLTALGAVTATAQEIEPRASISMEYSDNPFRTSSSAARSAAVLDGLVGLNIFHDGTLLYADVDASESRYQYLSGGVPSETLPNGYATIVANLVRDLFTWSVRDNIGQISDEPLDALAADNRQTVNVFSTGPDLLLPIGDRNHFVANLRYGTSTFNGSNIDSSLYDGQAGLARDLTPDSRISANYSYRKTLFEDDQVYPAIEVEVPFLRYSVETARTKLVAEGGWESMRFGTAGSARTPHALLSLERRLSPRLTLEAEYTHTYSDAAQNFVVNSRNAFTAGTDQNVQALAAPFKMDSGYLMLSRTAGRTLLSFEVTGEHDKYDAAPIADRHSYGADLAADYRVSSLITADVRVGWFRENFPATQQQDSWTEGSLALVRQLGESLRVSVEVLRAQGTGSLAGNRFKEDRALLTISYDPAAARRLRLFDPVAPFRYYEQPTLGRPMTQAASGAQ